MNSLIAIESEFVYIDQNILCDEGPVLKRLVGTQYLQKFIDAITLLCFKRRLFFFFAGESTGKPGGNG